METSHIPGTSTCKNCGYLASARAPFCPECGHGLTRGSSGISATHISLTALAIALIGVIGVFVYSHDHSDINESIGMVQESLDQSEKERVKKTRGIQENLDFISKDLDNHSHHSPALKVTEEDVRALELELKKTSDSLAGLELQVRFLEEQSPSSSLQSRNAPIVSNVKAQGQSVRVAGSLHRAPTSQRNFIATLVEYKKLAEGKARESTSSLRVGGATKAPQARLHFERDAELTTALSKGFRSVPQLADMKLQDAYGLALGDLKRIFPGSTILTYLSSVQGYNQALELLNRFGSANNARYPNDAIEELSMAEQYLEIPDYFSGWTAKVTHGSNPIGLDITLDDGTGFALEFGDTMESYTASFSRFLIGDQVLISGRFLRNSSGLFGSPDDLSWRKRISATVDRSSSSLMSPFLVALSESRRVTITEEIIESQEGADASLIHPSFFVEILEITKNTGNNSDWIKESAKKLSVSLSSVLDVFKEAKDQIRERVKVLQEAQQFLRGYKNELTRRDLKLKSAVEKYWRQGVAGRVKPQYLQKHKYEEFTAKLNRNYYYGDLEKGLAKFHKSLAEDLKKPDFGSLVIKKAQLLQLMDVISHEYHINTIYLDWRMDYHGIVHGGNNLGNAKAMEKIQDEMLKLDTAHHELASILNSTQGRSVGDFLKSLNEGRLTDSSGLGQR